MFINDDGVECIIMLDVGMDTAATDAEVLAQMNEVLRSEQLSQCEPTSEPILMAIRVKELDSYGQPKWDSVSYLAEYRVDREKLKTLLSAGAPDSQLGAVLTPVQE
jgi:hypothetical protein